MIYMGGFLKWGNPQIIQFIIDQIRLETYGDLGIPHGKKPPYWYIMKVF